MTSPPQLTIAPAVEFRNVHKSYGDFAAVTDLCLSIPKGTLVTLLGPSGCGKTTTLRLIAGLEIATAGKIFVDGVEVTGRPPSERDISMVFQSYALFPHMSVLRNVGYGLVASGLSRKKADESASRALELVGLETLSGRLPSELSGGQQQRVAVARAIVLEPAVLLLDEPLSNLDARLRRQVRDDIRALQQRLGLTAVYVTHDQEEAMAVADQIVVMNQGRIAQTGSPHDLYREPTDLFVARFMGDANILPALIERVSDEGIASVRLADLDFQLPARGLWPGPVAIAIRPEAIQIAPARSGTIPGLIGTVVNGVFLGDRLDYSIETSVGRLAVRAASDVTELQPGASVHLILSPIGMALLPA
jgi:iron(III) transport system ATP-binding protein